MERVHDLVPFVHVADPKRSVAFYERLGLEMVNSLAPEGQLVWAFLRNEHACLMVAQASAPIEPEQQAVLLYVYARDLAALREQLLDDGLPVGEIYYPEHMPEGELRVTDPDGYVLLIGQLTDPSHRR
jgi:catechol 2,3-dioxygenase-like lactoylglutathione lyase family enzyme